MLRIGGKSYQSTFRQSRGTEVALLCSAAFILHGSHRELALHMKGRFERSGKRNRLPTQFECQNIDEHPRCANRAAYTGISLQRPLGRSAAHHRD